MSDPSDFNLGKRSISSDPSNLHSPATASPMATLRPRKKKKCEPLVLWSKEQDELLLATVDELGPGNWIKIAKSIPDKSALECNQRWEKVLKPSSRKGNWSDEEDKILNDWVKEQGACNWTECAKLIIGRSGKQCRERWVNTLDPKVQRGNWEIDDQRLIFELLGRYKTSWSSIAKTMPGRTENSIKNYFYSTIRRIQATKLLEYVQKIKSVLPIQMYTKEDFMTEFEIDKLNELGRLMAIYIFENKLDSDTEFREFLITMISEEKKKKKISTRTKRTLAKEKRSKSKGTDKPLGKRGRKPRLKNNDIDILKSQVEAPFITKLQRNDSDQHSASILDPNLNGINPLLPLFLFSQGGVVMPKYPLPFSLPKNSAHSGTQQSKSDELSNIANGKADPNLMKFLLNGENDVHVPEFRNSNQNSSYHQSQGLSSDGPAQNRIESIPQNQLNSFLGGIDQQKSEQNMNAMMKLLSLFNPATCDLSQTATGDAASNDGRLKIKVPFCLKCMSGHQHQH